MTPDVAFELTSRRDLDGAGRTGSMDKGPGQVDIVAALLEALNSPDAYRLIHRGGELFLELSSEMRCP